MFRSFVLIVGGLASLSATAVYAQDAILGQKYGMGVHAYFAGDYQRAYDELTSAINGGSKDARVYYFRGLTHLKLGRCPEATNDFRAGASLESKDLNKFYNVAKSLERVQGESRMELEKYRVEARMAAMEETERLRRARYEAIRREESRVVNPQALGPAEPLVPQPPAAAPPADSDESTDVFAPETKPPAKKPAGKADTKPALPAEPPPAAEEPAAEKPAAEEPAAEKPAAETPAPKVEANPFE